MNILKIIQDALVGKELTLFTNSEIRQGNTIGSIFCYRKDTYHDKEIKVIITKVDIDSWGRYDEYAEYVIIYFMFNNIEKSICFTATNLDTELIIQ